MPFQPLKLYRTLMEVEKQDDNSLNTLKQLSLFLFSILHVIATQVAIAVLRIKLMCYILINHINSDTELDRAFFARVLFCRSNQVLFGIITLFRSKPF